MQNTEHIMNLLIKGSEYLNMHHNLQKACEYYAEARRCIKNLYGNNSELNSFINIFDFIWEEHHGDYRGAALKLADAGTFIESFCEQDVSDEFTRLIFERKDALLDGVAADTLKMLMRMDFEYSFDDIIKQCILARNDVEEIMNRTFIDRLGLPRRFHYLIQNLNRKKPDITQDMRYDLIQMLDFMDKVKDQDIESLSQEDRINHANKIYNFIQNNMSMWSEQLGAGMSVFLENRKNQIAYDMFRGMVKMGEQERAEEILSHLEQIEFDDIDSKIQIEQTKCRLEYQRGNKADAENLLDEIIQMEDKVILQVYAIKDERKKIAFLKDMEALIKQTIDLCNEVRGAKAAYDRVLRTRTLSFDRSGTRMNNMLYMNFIQEMQRLDEREQQGEEVSFERAEWWNIFDRESNGILSLNSEQVCRMLDESQAVIEFSVFRDISDYEFYSVFIVSVYGISVVKLGECQEIDVLVDALLQYIQNYSVYKYSQCPMNMLSQYYEMYTKVLVPIGDVLPRSVHKLFIAPAGSFLKIPFGMLPSFQWYDEIMTEKYQICYLNSGKELLRNASRTEKGDIIADSVVVGAYDFDGKYPALPASLQEAEDVAKFLNVRPYVGAQAVPDCLKKRAAIFHIVTHSFAEDSTKADSDPMEQTGLVFTGGKKLTAKEISQIDMTHTKLVVLSVCGVDEVRGVYCDIGLGIRKAFINAGVQCMLLNLWKTDDNVAGMIMKCFYHHYIREHMNVEQSLQKAKHYVRTSTVKMIRNEPYYSETMEDVFSGMEEDKIPYAHPYYWAGYIVMGYVDDRLSERIVS